MRLGWQIFPAASQNDIVNLNADADEFMEGCWNSNANVSFFTFQYVCAILINGALKMKVSFFVIVGTIVASRTQF